jgi:hypothetical protein
VQLISQYPTRGGMEMTKVKLKIMMLLQRVAPTNGGRAGAGAHREHG